MVHINPIAQVNQSGPFSAFPLQQVDAPSASLDEQTGGQIVRIAYMSLEILHQIISVVAVLGKSDRLALNDTKRAIHPEGMRRVMESSKCYH